MRNALKTHWFFILLLLILSTFYFWGINRVPFHPDESTQLFMSADFMQLTTDPIDMAWVDDTSNSNVSQYRLLDAPLTRYILGFGRTIFSLPPLSEDWDWSATWAENQNSGALPSENMLHLGRLVIACLFPLSLFLLYKIGIELDSRWLGIALIILFSSNALVLLHTRRAMAEGPLIFGIILTLFAILQADKRPLLTGIAVAIAFNAKQSALVLLPVCLVAVCWIPDVKLRTPQLIAKNSTKFLASFVLLTAILNPFLWRQPLSAARAALNLRQDLLERQVADITHLDPSYVLKSHSQRTAAVITQLFFAPPIFSEVGNYLKETRQQEDQYLQAKFHTLLRNPIAGAVMFGLAILGIMTSVRRLIIAESRMRRVLILLLFSLFSLAAGIILMVPLPWQRYSIPLVPIVIIFSGLGLVWLTKNSRRILSYRSIISRLSQVLAQFSPDSRMS